MKVGKMLSKSAKVFLIMCALVCCTATCLAIAFTTVTKAKAEIAKAPAAGGTTIYYDSAASNQGGSLATVVPKTYAAGGAENIVIQYVLKEGNVETNGRYQFEYGCSLENDGSPVWVGVQTEFGSGFVYTDNTISPFMAKSNVGKRITLILSRAWFVEKIYVTDASADLTFKKGTYGLELEGYTFTDGASAGYDVNPAGVPANNRFDYNIIKNATIITMNPGAGKGCFEDFKCFDENGDKVEYVLSGCYSTVLNNDNEDILSECKTGETSIAKPIDMLYNNPNGSLEETNDPNGAATGCRTGIISAEDGLLKKMNLKAQDGVASLFFPQKWHYKTALKFGAEINASALKSLTFRIYGNDFYYNESSSFGSGSIKLLPSDLLGGDITKGVHLNLFADSAITVDNPMSDFINVTIPASEVMKLADSNGKIGGFQIVRINDEATNVYFFIDRITCEYKLEFDDDSADCAQFSTKNVKAGDTVTVNVTNNQKEDLSYAPVVNSIDANGDKTAIDATVTENAITFVMPEAESVKISLFKLPVYNVVYQLDGGENDSANLTEWDSALPLVLKDATKEYYDFVGWYSSASFEEDKKVVSLSKELVTNENTATLYAKFTKKVYTITFDSNGGNDVAQVVSAWGETVAAPTTPAKEYCTFAGWTLNGEEYAFSVMPHEDITLTATWMGNEYNIAIVENDGATVTCDNKARYGAKVGFSVAMDKGYTIDQITVTAAGKNCEVLSDSGYYFVMPHCDASVSVSVKEIKYQINYHNVEGLVNNNPLEASYSDTVTLEAVQKDGYKFAGWYKDEGCTEKVESLNNEESNVDLYAKFTVQSRSCASSFDYPFIFTGILIAVTLMLRKKESL